MSDIIGVPSTMQKIMIKGLAKVSIKKREKETHHLCTPRDIDIFWPIFVQIEKRGRI